MFERLVVAMMDGMVDVQTGVDGTTGVNDTAGEFGDAGAAAHSHRSRAMGLLGAAGRRRWLCVLVSLLAVAAVWSVADVVKLPQADSATLPTRVVSYTVRPGDTLWAYASSVTPKGGDIAQTVNELMSLNELDSAVLVPGQRIIVPAD